VGARGRRAHPARPRPVDRHLHQRARRDLATRQAGYEV
jgi:rRNA maturation protein Nop10